MIIYILLGILIFILSLFIPLFLAHRYLIVWARECDAIYKAYMYHLINLKESDLFHFYREMINGFLRGKKHEPSEKWKETVKSIKAAYKVLPLEDKKKIKIYI